ncbi:MAG: ORC-CDC6 family AAA ATPase [Opitutaceae bacterium]
MNNELSKTFINLSKRAEKNDRTALIESFVDVGPLSTVLTTIDNQILYGRRGTGKTHALIYVSGIVRKKGDIPVYVDLRKIGSTGGLYSDGSIPLAERATRLLIDVLTALHAELLEVVLDDYYGLNLSTVGPLLDSLADSITEVTVTGPVREEYATEAANKETEKNNSTLGLKTKGIEASLSSGTDSEASRKEGRKVVHEGNIAHRVHFGRIGSALQKLTDAIDGKRIWLMLDEWSVVPLELQPYLSDLLRRAVFPSNSITVKIGAIERRSSFQLKLEGNDYIGIELGGDASADLNMDDYMVFDNDENKAVAFFRSLIYRHLKALAKEHDVTIPPSPDEMVQVSFTQENVFREFVRAAEGIPRDAFYILSLAAQKDFGSPISMDTIRKCSKTWYQRDKETAVSANSSAIALLHWIIDSVIGDRRARAFLLQRGVSSNLVDSLFDSRVLHLLKRNISAHDQPGVRYDVYKIDYGCYVDLLSTVRSPQGLLNLDEGGYSDVPPDDYRAIRRAILDMNEFKREIANKAEQDNR